MICVAPCVWCAWCWCGLWPMFDNPDLKLPEHLLNGDGFGWLLWVVGLGGLVVVSWWLVALVWVVVA